mmetsp:Transcript_32458/g.85437  ORF Transcript_32458/g.85437 Transcript_32458/m.85437 type:complete len:206 (+) Transcript_32458:517-1134(+)
MRHRRVRQLFFGQHNGHSGGGQDRGARHRHRRHAPLTGAGRFSGRESKYSGYRCARRRRALFRGSERRRDYLNGSQRLPLLHHHCLVHLLCCRVRGRAFVRRCNRWKVRTPNPACGEPRKCRQPSHQPSPRPNEWSNEHWDRRATTYPRRPYAGRALVDVRVRGTALVVLGWGAAPKRWFSFRHGPRLFPHIVHLHRISHGCDRR